MCASALLLAPGTGCGGDEGSSTASTNPPASAGAAGKAGGSAGAATGGKAGAGASAGNASGGTASAGNASGGTASAGNTAAGAGGDLGQAGSPDDGPAPVCGDKYCDHEHGEECTDCPADCGACGVCGDGVCSKATDGGESCSSCEADCGKCSACGDGTCSGPSGETCQTCTEDCGACDTCGNGACDAEETCQSCAQDCGACKTCGNGTCDAGETCSNCADDCDSCPQCGDKVCNGNETTATCAQDCPPSVRKGCDTGDYKPFWGGLHAHTHVSDGDGTPNEAFDHASKQQMDFLWLSDHHNAITPAEFAGCVASANKHNKLGTFVTGCGYEKGIFKGEEHKSAWVGHFNVLFPNKLYKLSHNSPGIFQDIAECPECLGQFNHPPNPSNFDGYEYRAVAKDRVRLMEFNGGPWADKLPWFFKALDNGWTISPSWNEDNHHKKWGDDPQGTLVWAKELSRPAIRAGVAARRTAAVGDKGASIKVLADDKCWMGSQLTGLGKTNLTVTLRDKQEGDGFTSVTLYGNKGKKLNEKFCGDKNPCTIEFNENMTAAGYLVVVARQKDGGWLVSAPIWYDK